MTQPAPARRPRGIGCAVFAILGALLLGFVISIPLVNDAYARGVESALRALPVPPGTVVEDSSSAAAKLVGNGNGMQYLGALRVSSTRSEQQLQDFYDEQEPVSRSRVSVIPAGGEVAEELARARGVFTHPASDGLYIVYVWGDGPDWFFQTADLRGH